MTGVADMGWIAFGAALVVLFAWYFWHTAVSMIRSARQIADFLDTRSARTRQRLEQEAIHGRPPLWYRFGQKAAVLMIIAAAAALVWTKFRSA